MFGYFIAVVVGVISGWYITNSSSKVSPEKPVKTTSTYLKNINSSNEKSKISLSSSFAAIGYNPYDFLLIDFPHIMLAPAEVDNKTLQVAALGKLTIERVQIAKEHQLEDMKIVKSINAEQKSVAAIQSANIDRKLKIKGKELKLKKIRDKFQYSKELVLYETQLRAETTEVAIKIENKYNIKRADLLSSYYMRKRDVEKEIYRLFYSEQKDLFSAYKQTVVNRLIIKQNQEDVNLQMQAAKINSFSQANLVLSKGDLLKESQKEELEALKKKHQADILKYQAENDKILVKLIEFYDNQISKLEELKSKY